MFLLNKIGFIPVKMCVLQTWVLSHVFNIMKIWWFYSDKIFPNYGPDENFCCQIRIQCDTTDTGSRPPVPGDLGSGAVTHSARR
ncbi:hypothetical protein HanIR_Chr10g0456201 [Helianthus annuus]|nr:hypothetical protein HanIR_Chr10g0456201 [Helianthus annuus]